MAERDFGRRLGLDVALLLALALLAAFLPGGVSLRLGGGWVGAGGSGQAHHGTCEHAAQRGEPGQPGLRQSLHQVVKVLVVHGRRLLLSDADGKAFRPGVLALYSQPPSAIRLGTTTIPEG